MILHELRQGHCQDVAAEILIARGWPLVTAKQFVARTALSLNAPAASPAPPSTRPKPADMANPLSDDDRVIVAAMFKRRMIRGLMWMLGGIAISMASLSLSRLNGGGSFMFFGAMLFGMIDFLAGLVGWWRHRK